LVEDDLALSDNVTEALSEHGFTSISAHSVHDTERLGALNPFAGIVDLRIPGGGSGEGMRQLATRFPGLPMIVITAHDDAPPMPARRVLRKPFDMGALLGELESLYSERVR